MSLALVCTRIPLLFTSEFMYISISLLFYDILFSFLLPIHPDTVNNQTITIEDLEMLYVLQESENEAVLTTVDGFGITKASAGPYTCLATNNLTLAGIPLTVNVLGDSLVILI